LIDETTDQSDCQFHGYIIVVYMYNCLPTQHLSRGWCSGRQGRVSYHGAVPPR
jgi:hypothetical protein